MKAAFGKDRVFLDTEDIEPGEDFSEKIRSHLERAGVFIVLIGKGWLSARGKYERRRLDHPKDWVRREIRTALGCKNCKVIPVLLDDAELPTEKEALPRDISALLKLQQIRVSQASSEHDIERLILEIENRGFERLVSAPDSSSPVTRETVGITLRIPKVEAAKTLKQLIETGNILLDEQHKSPPSSREQLAFASSAWHSWRRHSEQAMSELFSSSEPLRWLQALSPRHLDFNEPLAARMKELPRDIEKEVDYFQNLLARLDNYDEKAVGTD